MTSDHIAVGFPRQDGNLPFTEVIATFLPVNPLKPNLPPLCITPLPQLNVKCVAFARKSVRSPKVLVFQKFRIWRGGGGRGARASRVYRETCQNIVQGLFTMGRGRSGGVRDGEEGAY